MMPDLNAPRGRQRGYVSLGSSSTMKDRDKLSPQTSGTSLAYHNMHLNDRGGVIVKQQIEEMRANQGLCTTCKGEPVQLYEVRKSKLNPLWKSREPLTVRNEVYKGVCLRCHPHIHPHATASAARRASLVHYDSVGSLRSPGGSVRSITTHSSNSSSSDDGVAKAATHPAVDDWSPLGSRGSLSASDKDSPMRSNSYGSLPDINSLFPYTADSVTLSAIMRSDDDVSAMDDFSVPDFSQGSRETFRSHRSKTGKKKHSTSSRRSRDDSNEMSLQGQPLKTERPPERGATSSGGDRVASMSDIPFNPIGYDLFEMHQEGKRRSSTGTMTSREDNTISDDFSKLRFDENLESDYTPTKQHRAKRPPKPKAPSTSVKRSPVHSVASQYFPALPLSVSGLPAEDSKLSPLLERFDSNPPYRDPSGRSSERTESISSRDCPSLPAPPSLSAQYSPPSRHQKPAFDLDTHAGRRQQSDDASGLAPPSLVGMDEAFLGVSHSMDEPSSATVNSSLEEFDALIKDVTAAGSPELLCELLANTMRSHRDREDILSLCLDTIWNLSKYNDSNKSHIMAVGLFDDIVGAMKDHRSSVRVQQSGCGVLWSLSVNQYNRVILVRAGALNRIFRGLECHLNDEPFVSTAMGALRTLSPEREVRIALGPLLGAQRVVRAMALHRTVASIQRDGCAFLSNIAVDMDNQVVSVASTEELHAIVRAMGDHLKNDAVMASACFALKNYTYEEKNLRNLRRFEDVISLLEDAAQYCTKANCRADATEVLDRVRRLRAEDDSLEVIAFDSLMHAMRRQAMNSNFDQLVEESVSTVADIIKEYYWSIKLICFGLESLSELAGKSQLHQARIMQLNTLRVVMGTLNEHQGNSKVQARGCALLKILAEISSANRFEIYKQDGVHIILTALRRHRGDEPVQLEGFSALKVLSREPCCAQEIERSGGLRQIDEEQSVQDGEDDNDTRNPLSILA